MRGQRSVTPLPDGFARQALHAWRLGLIHPKTRRALHWEAPVPDDMAALAAALGLGEGEDEADFDTFEFDAAYSDEGYAIGSDEDDYADEDDDEGDSE